MVTTKNNAAIPASAHAIAIERDRRRFFCSFVSCIMRLPLPDQSAKCMLRQQHGEQEHQIQN